MLVPDTRGICKSIFPVPSNVSLLIVFKVVVPPCIVIFPFPSMLSLFIVFIFSPLINCDCLLSSAFFKSVCSAIFPFIFPP